MRSIYVTNWPRFARSTPASKSGTICGCPTSLRVMRQNWNVPPITASKSWASTPSVGLLLHPAYDFLNSSYRPEIVRPLMRLRNLSRFACSAMESA
jgi:hypothetical protein